MLQNSGIIEIVEYHTILDSVQQLHVQQLSTYAKPGIASAVLDS